MGFLGDAQKYYSDGGGKCVAGGLRCLVRRKQVDSSHSKSTPPGSGHNQLAKALSIPHLVAIGKIIFFNNLCGQLSHMLFWILRGLVLYRCFLLYLMVVFLGVSAVDFLFIHQFLI